MKYLNATRRLYNEVNSEILLNFSGDTELLECILSDFICFKIFADYDYQLNTIIKRFLLSNNIEPRKKEIGFLKPSEIKKILRKRFLISKKELSFLDNRADFTRFIVERHLISHAPNTVSISFSQAQIYINEAEEILNAIDIALKKNGRIQKGRNIFYRIFICLNRLFHYTK